MLIFSFLFGLIVGSFLNSIIYRIKTKESIIFTRSHCPFCNKTLKWYELIPLLSFIAQKGQCRSCGAKISLQYPLVELVTGLIFAFIIYYKFSIFDFQVSSFRFQVLELLYYLFISSIFIVIFVYDYLYYEIPNVALVFGIIASLIYNLLRFNLNRWGEEFFNLFFAAFITAGFFYLIWLVSRGRWLGFGDVKLAILLGLILGWPQILLALFLAFGSGAILGILLIISGKKTLKSQIPFGPFLIFGTFITMFFGSKLINWYLSFLIF